MNVHRYHSDAKTWRVEKRDAVVVLRDGTPTVIGYNHSRAWRAAMEAAR